MRMILKRWLCEAAHSMRKYLCERCTCAFNLFKAGRFFGCGVSVEPKGNSDQQDEYWLLTFASWNGNELNSTYNSNNWNFKTWTLECENCETSIGRCACHDWELRVSRGRWHPLRGQQRYEACTQRESSAHFVCEDTKHSPVITG